MLHLDFTEKSSSISADMSGDERTKYNTLDYYTEPGLFLTTFQRELLLKSIQADLRPEYRRRIEIIMLADKGYSQTEICTSLGCSQETARHWIAMAQAGLAHKWNDRPIGRPKKVNEQYLERLKELVNHSPREYGYSFQCWTAEYLSKQLAKDFGIKFSDRHINRLLHELGLSTRQNRKKVEIEITDLSGNEKSGITIRDLQSSSEPDFLWSFSLSKTSK
jgi:transposase